MFSVFCSGREEKIASSLRTYRSTRLRISRGRLRGVDAGVPLLGVHQRCVHFGTKSGSREVFLNTGIPHPQGTKLCYSKRELAKEITVLWRYLQCKYRQLSEGRSDSQMWRGLMPKKVVLKLDDAFSGEGNALLDISHLFDYRGESPDDEELISLIEEQFTDVRTRFQAEKESWATFSKTMETVGALAEIFLDSSESDVRCLASALIRLIGSRLTPRIGIRQGRHVSIAMAKSTSWRPMNRCWLMRIPREARHC